ncbi:MAG TPA: DUF222 domain-containing protein [Marmoricola sp.]|nr:DUF222 domain-containing protein [Marmoricola sp.]
MTVHALPRPELVARLVEVRETLGDAQRVAPEQLSDHEVEESLVELTALESQVSSLRLAVLGEVEQRRIAEKHAATGPEAWAAALTGESVGRVAGGLRISRQLRERYHHTREAFAAGELRLEQVRVITDSLHYAPQEATAEQLATAEEWLVGRATGRISRTGRPLSPKRLRQVARRAFAIVSAELADAHEEAMLSSRESAAEHDAYLAMHDNDDGTWSGRFVIPELHAQLLSRALDRLTSPRRMGARANGADTDDPTALAGPGWQRSSTERAGNGFMELLEHLPELGYAANGTTLLVTIGLDQLRTGLGAAGLDTGVHISASEARRLACEAAIVPVVLGGASVPLDLGRTRRLHSSGQRLALATQHDSCGIGGCERPFAWCEIHHLDPWSAHGRTDLAKALPMCGHHHRRAHDDRYDLRRHASGEWRFHRRG